MPPTRPTSSRPSAPSRTQAPKQAAPVAKKPPAAPPKKTLALPKNEFSTGQGRALRLQALGGKPAPAVSTAVVRQETARRLTGEIPVQHPPQGTADRLERDAQRGTQLPETRTADRLERDAQRGTRLPETRTADRLERDAQRGTRLPETRTADRIERDALRPRETRTADQLDRARGGRVDAPSTPSDVRAAQKRVDQAKPADRPRILLEEAKKLDDPKKVDQLVEATEPALAETAKADAVLARNGGSANEAALRGRYDDLTAVAELGTTEGAASLAKTYAPVVAANPELSAKFAREGIEQGKGAVFAVALTGELEATGQTGAASELAGATTAGLEKVQSNFEDAQAKVDELNEELGNLVARSNGLLTPEQLQVAIDDFKADHAEDYAALEKSGEIYAKSMDGAARATSDAALTGSSSENIRDLVGRATEFQTKNFQALGETKAGSEYLADELEAQADGNPSIFDNITSLNDDIGFATTVAETAFGAATLAVMGDPQRLESMLQGLKKAGPLLGIDAKKLDEVLSDVGRLPTASPDEVKALTAKVQKGLDELGIGGDESTLSKSISGLAIAAGTIGFVGGVANFSEADLAERTSIIVGGLDTGVQALEFFGRAAKFTKFAGPALGALSSILEGFNAVSAFRNGDTLQGISHTASAIGGGLLTLSAVTSLVPGGVVVGGVLVAIGVGVSHYAKVQKSNEFEGPLEDFLKAGGLSQKLAEELSNHGGDGFPAGPAIAAMAAHVGISTAELMAHLETLSEGDLQNFIEQGVHAVDPNDDGTLPMSPELAAVFREGVPDGFRPPTVDSLAVWAEQNGYLPPGVTAPS